MKTRVVVTLLSAGAILATACACTPQQVQSAGNMIAPPASPKSVCQDIVAVQSAPDAAGQLNALDIHSALGVLWADAQSACKGAVPAAGVDPSWGSAVWHMVLQTAPVVLPKLIPFLITLVKGTPSAEHA